MKSFSVSVLVACLLVGGCVPFWKNNTPVPTTATNGVRLHQSWCYETLAQVDCYDSPQDFAPGRLVNVYPTARLPLDKEEYDKALAESR